MKKIKNKEERKTLKKTRKEKSLILEKHIIDIIKSLEKKKNVKKSIDSVIKKIKEKVEFKESKKKEEIKEEVYGSILKNSYEGLSSVYEQKNHFEYKSNIKENKENYTHLIVKAEGRDELGEKNLVSSEMMDDYARKTSLNFLFGANVNDVSVEEKESMFHAMYDPTQKAVYLAKIETIGFGRDKIMHSAPIDSLDV